MHANQFADFNIDDDSAMLKKAGTNRPSEKRPAASYVWRGLSFKVGKTNTTYVIGAKMKQSRSYIFVALLAAAVLALVTIPHKAANAQMNCSIAIEIVKGGFIVGLGGGSGTLTCGDKKYALEVGGIKAGLLIGAAKANLRGPVRNLHKVSDIEGTYAGAGAGIAVGGGLKGVVVRNEKGVELSLSGTQVGIEGGLDLSGTVVRLKR